MPRITVVLILTLTALGLVVGPVAAADGSVLGTQIQGLATKDASGVTQFASTLGVLDGTGTYVGATGTGTFAGSRDAALGQPVKATFTITVLPAK